MRRLDEAITLVPELRREDLERWMGEALTEAWHDANNTILTDAQFARVRLICTLRFDMEVEEEVLPVVLDLLDQLHETRQRLHRLSQAVLAQDEEVKSSVLEMLSKVKLR